MAREPQDGEKRTVIVQLEVTLYYMSPNMYTSEPCWSAQESWQYLGRRVEEAAVEKAKQQDWEGKPDQEVKQ